MILEVIPRNTLPNPTLCAIVCADIYNLLSMDIMVRAIDITDELSEKLDAAMPANLLALSVIKSLIYRTEDMTDQRKEIADIIENTEIEANTLKEIVLTKLDLGELEQDKLLVGEAKKMISVMEDGLQEEMEAYQQTCHKIIMAYHKEMQRKAN